MGPVYVDPDVGADAGILWIVAIVLWAGLAAWITIEKRIRK